MLNELQQRLLLMPFPVSAHAFVYGKCYLIKGAIRARLNAVDPTWELTRPELVARSGNVVTLSGGLTICGVTRHSTGTGIIQLLDPKIDKTTGDEIPPTAYEQSRMEAKAYKSAARDLLPRCAVEFGVGEYLKDLPKSVSDERGLAKWLEGFPPHWATSNGGNRIRSLIAELSLEPDEVATLTEPGRVLTRISDTWLTEEQFTERLLAIAEELGLTGTGEITEGAGHGAE